jgi:hypothetical protein
LPPTALLAPLGPSTSINVKTIIWSIPTASLIDTPAASFSSSKFTPLIITLDAFLSESSQLNKRTHFKDSEETVK